jgi:hypothetical protein
LTQAMDDATGAYMVRWTFKLLIILYLYSTHYIDQWAMDRVLSDGYEWLSGASAAGWR